MHSPAQFGELFLDVGKGVAECATPVRAGGSLGENPLTLQFERLANAGALCCSGGVVLGFWLWS